MTNLQANTPKTDLTLSAVDELLPEDARSAAVIDRTLELIDRADGDPQQRERLTEQLIDYVWPAAVLRDERDPLTPQLQREREHRRLPGLERELAPLSESELRALWGDR